MRTIITAGTVGTEVLVAGAVLVAAAALPLSGLAAAVLMHRIQGHTA